MPGVLITYPHANVVSHNFHHSLLKTMGLCRDMITDVLPVRCNPGDGLILGRNHAMRTFLDSDAEWLWTLDTDIGFLPDTLNRLLEHGSFVASALYRTVWEGPGTDRMGGPDTWSICPLAFNATGSGGFRQIESTSGIQEVDATGAGCMLVHRSAAEMVCDKFGDNWWTIARPYGDDRSMGEDFSFCWRLGECGIKVTLDCDIKLTHHKQVWI